MRVQLSDILLTLEVSILLFTQILLLILLSVAMFHTYIILDKYKKGESTQEQYELEKRSYLIIVIISSVLIVKVLLLPFFVYTINELSTIIPGAMCGAGVIDSNEYGSPLLVLKIVIIILASLWISLNKEDQRAKNSPYFKKKLYFFILIYLLIIIELYFEISFLTLLTTDSPVLCCSAIYSDDKNPIPFNLSSLELVGVFYTLFLGIIFSVYKRSRIGLFIFSIAFTYIAYYTIIYFFGIYIYELPSHICPFCLLQAEYNYIGYFIYGSLFIALYYALSVSFYKFLSSAYKFVAIWYLIFILFTSFDFMIYLLENGVFL